MGIDWLIGINDNDIPLWGNPMVVLMISHDNDNDIP